MTNFQPYDSRESFIAALEDLQVAQLDNINDKCPYCWGLQDETVAPEARCLSVPRHVRIPCCGKAFGRKCLLKALTKKVRLCPWCRTPVYKPHVKNRTPGAGTPEPPSAIEHVNTFYTMVIGQLGDSLWLVTTFLAVWQCILALVFILNFNCYQPPELSSVMITKSQIGFTNIVLLGYGLVQFNRLTTAWPGASLAINIPQKISIPMKHIVRLVSMSFIILCMQFMARVTPDFTLLAAVIIAELANPLNRRCMKILNQLVQGWSLFYACLWLVWILVFVILGYSLIETGNKLVEFLKMLKGVCPVTRG